MIKSIKVLSRVDLEQNWNAVNGSLRKYYGCMKMAFVSIHSSDKTPCRQLECESLLLAFDDVIIDVDWGVAPSEQHITKIRAFLNNIHNSPDEYLLICQCDGGSSRSGAVGEFAANIAGISNLDFKRENPQVIPNVLMRSLFNMVHEQQIA